MSKQERKAILFARTTDELLPLMAHWNNDEYCF